MTEEEWLACTDLHRLLLVREVRNNERKLLLFAAHCARRVLSLLPDDAGRLVEHLEQAAEGPPSPHQLGSFREVVLLTRSIAGRSSRGPHYAPNLAGAVGELAIEARVLKAAQARPTRRPTPKAVRNKERRAQRELLRDLYGNPYRPAALRPDWLAWNGGAVRLLARTMYEERAFQQLPVLGDALEEAGCDHADVLAHCRARAPHARGCWVLDLLLGKESGPAVATP
jgi:hypothetical protein